MASSFKKPMATHDMSVAPVRTPSPPHSSMVEPFTPLSATSSLPALPANSTKTDSGYSQGPKHISEMQDGLQTTVASINAGLANLEASQGSSSAMDAFASIALATSPKRAEFGDGFDDSKTSSHRKLSNKTSDGAYYESGLQERPKKRSKSETPFPRGLTGYGERPATSHIPSTADGLNSDGWQDQAYRNASNNTDDAELLLNVSRAAFAQDSPKLGTFAHALNPAVNQPADWRVQIQVTGGPINLSNGSQTACSHGSNDDGRLYEKSRVRKGLHDLNDQPQGETIINGSQGSRMTNGDLKLKRNAGTASKEKPRAGINRTRGIKKFGQTFKDVKSRKTIKRRHSFESFDMLVVKETVNPSPKIPDGRLRRSHSEAVLPLLHQKVQISKTAPQGKAPIARESKSNNTPVFCGQCKATAALRESRVDSDDLSWISCDACKKWFHYGCAGFSSEKEVRAVDKFICQKCKPKHGQTTYVRKSSRAHTAIDYAGLNEGLLKTSDDTPEHPYIAPIKDGTIQFAPEQFPRIRPELITLDFFEKGNGTKEPLVIPAWMNPKQKTIFTTYDDDESTDNIKQESKETPLSYAEECQSIEMIDDGQDLLDMVMPRNLTVRRVAELYGPEEKVDVIDVKSQGEDGRWKLRRWADYYENDTRKYIRNVISLEISHSPLARLVRRPRAVRDMDLVDSVWPLESKERGDFPKVQLYCLMSVADSYTDFHIDFGGSSVFYHILKGKKTFFFIPPKNKHLKKYEQWCLSPGQNHTFLPDLTKECYRVDLSEGDTMMIPSGWIHAVWTPEDSLVIGGNFLSRLQYATQIQVAEIEKTTKVPTKFRHPHFQRIMWYSALKYLRDDDIPQEVSDLLVSGKPFPREVPPYQQLDQWGVNSKAGPKNYQARYYSQHELEGLPHLIRFLLRTALISVGKITDGISEDSRQRVTRAIPKGHGDPVDVIKKFAIWAAWKRGNEVIPDWAHPEASIPGDLPSTGGSKKNMSAAAIKRMERKEAQEALKAAPRRRSSRGTSVNAAASPAKAEVGSTQDQRHTYQDAVKNEEPSAGTTGIDSTKIKTPTTNVNTNASVPSSKKRRSIDNSTSPRKSKIPKTGGTDESKRAASTDASAISSPTNTGSKKRRSTGSSDESRKSKIPKTDTGSDAGRRNSVIEDGLGPEMKEETAAAEESSGLHASTVENVESSNDLVEATIVKQENTTDVPQTILASAANLSPPEGSEDAFDTSPQGTVASLPSKEGFVPPQQKPLSPPRSPSMEDGTVLVEQKLTTKSHDEGKKESTQPRRTSRTTQPVQLLSKETAKSPTKQTMPKAASPQTKTKTTRAKSAPKPKASGVNGVSKTKKSSPVTQPSKRASTSPSKRDVEQITRTLEDENLKAAKAAEFSLRRRGQ